MTLNLFLLCIVAFLNAQHTHSPPKKTTKIVFCSFQDTCPAGYLNDLGELTCRECGFGNYQPIENQVYCHSCNNSLTTDVPHATNVTQCTGTYNLSKTSISGGSS